MRVFKKKTSELTKRDLRELRKWFLEHRSRRSRKMDVKRRARTPVYVRTWLRHPDRYDILGVDTPRGTNEWKGFKGGPGATRELQNLVIKILNDHDGKNYKANMRHLYHYIATRILNVSRDIAEYWEAIHLYGGGGRGKPWRDAYYYLRDLWDTYNRLDVKYNDEEELDEILKALGLTRGEIEEMIRFYHQLNPNLRSIVVAVPREVFEKYDWRTIYEKARKRFLQELKSLYARLPSKRILDIIDVYVPSREELDKRIPGTSDTVKTRLVLQYDPYSDSYVLDIPLTLEGINPYDTMFTPSSIVGAIIGLWGMAQLARKHKPQELKEKAEKLLDKLDRIVGTFIIEDMDRKDNGVTVKLRNVENDKQVTLEFKYKLLKRDSVGILVIRGDADLVKEIYDNILVTPPKPIRRKTIRVAKGQGTARIVFEFPAIYRTSRKELFNLQVKHVENALEKLVNGILGIIAGLQF